MGHADIKPERTSADAQVGLCLLCSHVQFMISCDKATNGYVGIRNNNLVEVEGSEA